MSLLKALRNEFCQGKLLMNPVTISADGVIQESMVSLVLCWALEACVSRLPAGVETPNVPVPLPVTPQLAEGELPP